MLQDRCKKCRRVGEKLFLKGDKCISAHCPVSRKPYAPGKQGKKKGKRGFGGGSEFAVQMKEKQKIKFGYGLREAQLATYVKEASKLSGEKTSAKLLDLLEMRLDNAVFRLGYADSRNAARQLVSHGHITINGRRVNVPSYQLKVGGKIAVRSQSADNKYFKDIDVKLKKHTPPVWLNLDKGTKVAIVTGKPDLVSSGIKKGLDTLLEFYSR